MKEEILAKEALQKEQTRLRVKRYREKKNSVTSDSVTGEALQSAHNTNSAAETDVLKDVEMVEASYVPGLKGEYKVLPERPRYLTLSDRQVLDRANQPCAVLSGKMIDRIKRANDSAYGMIPLSRPIPQAIKERMRRTPSSIL